MKTFFEESVWTAPEKIINTTTESKHVIWTKIKRSWNFWERNGWSVSVQWSLLSRMFWKSVTVLLQFIHLLTL